MRIYCKVNGDMCSWKLEDSDDHERGIAMVKAEYGASIEGAEETQQELLALVAIKRAQAMAR